MTQYHLLTSIFTPRTQIQSIQERLHLMKTVKILGYATVTETKTKYQSTTLPRTQQPQPTWIET